MVTVNVMLNSVERAKNFVSMASRFSCEFDLENGKSYVDAKSFLGVMSLDLRKPMSLHIYAERDEAEKVVKHMTPYLITA